MCYVCEKAFHTESELQYHGLDKNPEETDVFEAFFDKLVTQGEIVEVPDVMEARFL